MAKKPFDIVEDDDTTVDLDLKPRKLAGTDADPIDPDTGDSLFDDISPRFRMDEPDDDAGVIVRPSDEEDPDEEEDPEEDADTDEDEDEDPDGDEPRKSSVARRIERERRLRQEAEDNFRDVKRRLDEIDARTQAQASDAEFAQVKADIEAKLTDARTKLEKAIEDGDSKAQTQLTETMQDLKVDLRVKTQEHEAAKKVVTERSTTANSVVKRKVGQWLRQHQRFNTDPVFSQFVRAVDKAIAAEGFDPETDEFYEEMDRRISERYPEEYKGRKKGKDDAPRRQRPPSANFRREGDGTRPKRGEFNVKNGKVKLTARQIQIMRNFQLDPGNPADVREFVQNNRK